jgi:membrane protein DedA with SNARE-associated domain
MNSILIFITTWFVSILDRAGIPSAMVIALTATDLDNLNKTILITGCILAGSLGDIGCYYIGSWLKLKHQKSTSIFSKRSFYSKAEDVSHFIDRAPLTWIFIGRAFPAVNQFIPMAASIRGIAVEKVISISILGNIFWFSAFAIIADWLATFIGEAERSVQITAGVVGFFIVILSYRFNSRLENHTTNSSRN